MRKIIFIFSFITLHTFMAEAQEKLSLTDAVSMALKNNYSILISKNTAVIATNNNTAGNAGMLPSLSLNAAGTKSSNDTKQNYSSGLEVDRKGVPSTNVSAGAALNWTIFDGLNMFATQSKLKELQEKGELNLKLEIENTVAQIIASYFDVVRHKEILKAYENAIDIYKERVKIAETKFSIGSASKLELLQAKVDLNAQRSALLKERTAFNNSKNNLNQLLARAVDIDFEATDSMVIAYQPKLDDLKKTVRERNYSLLSAQKDLNISSNVIKQTEAQRFPKIGVNANYNYTRAENNVGFLLLNRNLGFNYGFTLSWNIFNGFNTSNQIKNVRLDYQNYSIRLNELKSQVESALLQAFRNFEDAGELLKLEEENLFLAKENVTVGLERFRIGNATQVELKEAQKSLDDAVNRTVSARYEAKLAETELMRLNGELVK
ncbi:MAG: TolC family protein [Bacteroidetes bacterium]|nr:TolC family protein [Bacteroidota bacterium]